MAIDADEEYESMCPKCQAEHDNAKHKCSRCGGAMSTGPAFVNPNFNAERFEKLSEES